MVELRIDLKQKKNKKIIKYKNTKKNKRRTR